MTLDSEVIIIETHCHHVSKQQCISYLILLYMEQNDHQVLRPEDKKMY